MPSLHRIQAGRVVRTPVERTRPLRLGPRGTLVEDGNATTPLASLVPFVLAGRSRYALVVREGARVFLGARRVADVAEVRDRDRIFVDRDEWLFSTDAHPTRVDAPPDASCPVCLERIGLGRGRPLLACPRCRAQACALCWERLPEGRCATPGCDQPASLDRPLWTPDPTDFLGFVEEER